MSTSFFSATGESTSCRSPCMDFLPPLGGVFRLSLTGSSPGIPCRRLCGFQGAVLNLAIKKSPHNNLNLTILSGMALARVRYVAIRKLKTCSAALRKRALLKTRHFRQSARKREGNFGEKREPDDSFYLFVFYQQRLIGFQLHISQPDGSALRGVILTTQSV